MKEPRVRPQQPILAAAVAALAILASPAAATAHHPDVPDVIEAHADGLHPEGIAYDPGRGEFLVSSVRHGTVSVVDADGTTTTLIDDPDLISTFGLGVDRRRGLVLVTDGDLGLSERTSPETVQRTAGLGVYDLATGEKVDYIDLDALAPDATAHAANDVAIAPDGTAYVTDTLAGLVYEIEPDGDASVLVEDPALAAPGGFGANGIVYRGGRLVIGNYSDGSLWTVDVDEPETIERVATEADLTGVDGLTWDGRTLVAVTNTLGGNGANAVHRLRLDRDLDEADELAVQAAPEQATTAAATGCAVYTVYGNLSALLSGAGTSDEFTIRRY
jgi:sugar lactone lactonase YvrE